VASGIFGYQSLKKFHIVNTNPSVHKVATVSPFFKINFNKQLSNDGLSVSTSQVVSSYVVSNKTLVFNLKTPMSSITTYSITINKIFDTNGNQIANQTFTFKPKVIDFKDLPEDQKQASIQLQAAHPSSKGNVGFVGIESLLNYGITDSQINDLEQGLFQYKQSAKIITLDTSSIKPVPHDPSSADVSDVINFNVGIDNTSYRAKLVYFNLTAIHLYLYNPQTGNQIYDSGVIDGTS
jgi:hypothetical protein